MLLEAPRFSIQVSDDPWTQCTRAMCSVLKVVSTSFALPLVLVRSHLHGATYRHLSGANHMLDVETGEETLQKNHQRNMYTA